METTAAIPCRWTRSRDMRKEILQNASGPAMDELERTSIPAQSTTNGNTAWASGEFLPASAAPSSKRCLAMMFENEADNSEDLDRGNISTKRERAHNESVWTDVQDKSTARGPLAASSGSSAVAGSLRPHGSSNFYCTKPDCEHSAFAIPHKPFEEQRSLNYHEKIAHNSSGNTQLCCLSCPDLPSFPLPKDLHRHRTDVHGSTSSVVSSTNSSDIGSRAVCITCGKSFQRWSDLRRHVSTIHGATLFVCPIPGCDRHSKGLGRRDKLLSHLRLAHRLVLPKGASEADFLNLWKRQKTRFHALGEQVSGSHAPDQSSGALTSPKRRFACPYFKYSTSKFSDARSCLGPGFADIHRLKEHLYRRHRLPPRCPRCMESFRLDSDVVKHMRSSPCPISDIKICRSEGFDHEQKEKIHLNTRRSHRSSDDERWRELYQILFPEVVRESIPSPYHEVRIVQGSPQTGSISQNLEQFQEYLSRELPQRIRDDIIETLDRAQQPVEDKLKIQLDEILRTTLVELSESYLALQTPDCHEELGRGTSISPNLRSPGLFGGTFDDLHSSDLIKEFVRGVANPSVPTFYEPSVWSLQSSGSWYRELSEGDCKEPSTMVDPILHCTPILDAEQPVLPLGLAEFDQESFGSPGSHLLFDK